MRPPAALLLSVPALLAGTQSQSGQRLDHGRLDPAWFGPAAVFQPSEALGFLWMKPGMDLRRRALRLMAWEPAVWLLGKRSRKDQGVLARLEGKLVPGLAKGLRRGLGGAVPVSMDEGDVLLAGRVADTVGNADNALFAQTACLSFDLKLVDGFTGELLGAFHATLEGRNAEDLSRQYDAWCERLGKELARAAVPPKLGGEK